MFGNNRLLNIQFTAIIFGFVYFDQDPVTPKTVTNINGVLILVVINTTFQARLFNSKIA